MKARKVILISPPFSSQLSPTLALAAAFHREGAQVRVACSEQFRDRISSMGFGFVPLVVNKNANTGVAQSTAQPEEERARLEAFLESTRAGAVQTLLRQSKDRKADMFMDPGVLRADLEAIDRKEKPDLWVSNQLSYAVTLALHCLGLPFVSFCPPHPLTIPEGGKIYGVPASWPGAIRADPKDLETLRKTALEVEKAFTGVFNHFLEEGCIHAEAVDNAFALTSSLAVLCNYPDFGNDPPHSSKTRRIYLGACVEEQELPERFGNLLKETRKHAPRILIVMGTFLSSRIDVLKACIESARSNYPESSIFVGAGASAYELKGMGFQDVFIEEFIPQKALLPHVDVVMHHGGNNSFTESLYFGTPMVILPFSSDQFDIASDAERLSIAEVLDPNNLTEASLGGSLERALSRKGGSNLKHWQDHVRGRGPRYGVRELAALGL